MIVKLKERLSFLKQLQYNVLDNHMNSLAIKNILKVKIKNILVKNILLKDCFMKFFSGKDNGFLQLLVNWLNNYLYNLLKFYFFYF